MYYEMDQRVLTLLRQGRVEEALTELNKIETDDDRYRRVLDHQKARLEIELGKYDDAKNHIVSAKSGLLKGRLYYQILLTEAKLYLESGYYHKAISTCDKAIKDRKLNDGLIPLTKGHALEKLGRYDEAEACYRLASQVAVKEGSKKSACYSLANLAFALGDFKEAETALLDYYALPGKINSKAQELLLGVYLRQGRNQEIIDYIDAHRAEDYYWMPSLRILALKQNGNHLYRSFSSYFPNQLVEYDKRDAITHLEATASGRDYSSGKAVFAANIKMEELFETAQLQLDTALKQYAPASDLYEITYPNVGYDNQGTIFDTLVVVTVPNTHDIITMYPTDRKVISRQDERNQTASLQYQKQTNN